MARSKRTSYPWRSLARCDGMCIVPGTFFATRISKPPWMWGPNASQQAVEEFVRAEGWQAVEPFGDRRVDVWIKTSPEAKSVTQGDTGRSITLPDPLPRGWQEQLRAFLLKNDPDRPFLHPPARQTARTRLPSQSVEQPPAPSAHAFISYSRHDQAYVDRLVTHLRSSGVIAWIDKSGIDYGSRWKSVVRTAVDSCGVCVVVMTPEGENSEWVDREISRAEEKHKPILPLLVRGSAFFALGHLHYEDLTGGNMPSNRWLTQLRKLLDSR